MNEMYLEKTDPIRYDSNDKIESIVHPVIMALALSLRETSPTVVACIELYAPNSRKLRFKKSKMINVLLQDTFKVSCFHLKFILSHIKLEKRV